MANRVLLDLTGLDVSKAGVDVTTAAKRDLLFTSDWTFVRELVSGITRVTYGAAKITIPFGLTLTRVPYIDIWFKQQNGSSYGRYFTAPTASDLGGYSLAYVTTSDIQFLWNSNPQSGITYWDIAYRVWGYSTP